MKFESGTFRSATESCIMSILLYVTKKHKKREKGNPGGTKGEQA